MTEKKKIKLFTKTRLYFILSGIILGSIIGTFRGQRANTRMAFDDIEQLTKNQSTIVDNMKIMVDNQGLLLIALKAAQEHKCNIE